MSNNFSGNFARLLRCFCFIDTVASVYHAREKVNVWYPFGFWYVSVSPVRGVPMCTHCVDIYVFLSLSLSFSFLHFITVHSQSWHHHINRQERMTKAKETWNIISACFCFMCVCYFPPVTIRKHCLIQSFKRHIQDLLPWLF